MALQTLYLFTQWIMFSGTLGAAEPRDCCPDPQSPLITAVSELSGVGSGYVDSLKAEFSESRTATEAQRREYLGALQMAKLETHSCKSRSPDQAVADIESIRERYGFGGPIKVPLRGLTNQGKACNFFEPLEGLNIIDLVNKGVAPARFPTGQVSERLSQIQWDPCCLPTTVTGLLNNPSTKKVTGFLVGSSTSAGVRIAKVFGVGGQVGQELVVTLGPNKTLLAQIFISIGGGLGASLDGEGPHSGVLLDCKDPQDYQGVFLDFEHLVQSNQYGKVGQGMNESCRSVSRKVLGGASLVGASTHYYFPVGPKFIISGPRVYKMVKHLKAAQQGFSDPGGSEGDGHYSKGADPSCGQDMFFQWAQPEFFAPEDSGLRKSR